MGRLQLAGSVDGGWLYTDHESGAKVEIQDELPPADELNFGGPVRQTLFDRFLAWCIPARWQSTVQEELDVTFAYLSSEDDRAVALVGALLVESAVNGLVAAYVPGYRKLADMRDFTFSMRIELARALMLCPSRLLGAADTVRNLRNEFARNLDIKTFDECKQGNLVSARDHLRLIDPGLADGKTSREVFVSLVGMLFLGFRGYQFHVERLNEYVRKTKDFHQRFHDYCHRRPSPTEGQQ